jgi:hypothetical protein
MAVPSALFFGSSVYDELFHPLFLVVIHQEFGTLAFRIGLGLRVGFNSRISEFIRRMRIAFIAITVIAKKQ